MIAPLSLYDLKDRGSGVPAPPEVARLYHQAFDEFHIQALWNWRRLDRPTITQALAIADSLRAKGDLAAWRLAGQIESACRAAV